MPAVLEKIGTQTMTNRERILATLRGEETDRFPVWLKMANATWRLSQPEPYRSMESVDLLAAAGCDLMASNYLNVRAEHAHITRQTTQEGGRRITVTTTPEGELVREEKLDPTTQSWHPARYPVQSADDLRRLRWCYTDTTYAVKEEQARAALARKQRLTDRDLIVNSSVGPGPLMQLVEHICGPEQTVYLMYDEPELFAEVLALMHGDRLRLLEAKLALPVCDTFWMVENTSTSLISPSMFEQFCVPHLTDYGNRILQAGIIPVHHMCGLLNALLETIDALPATVNEAFTTRPLGDVSLAEGRTRMPSKALIGGTNATLWLEPVEKIVETVAEDLANCPDRRRIFLTSAGVLPPLVSFEKAKRVADAFKTL